MDAIKAKIVANPLVAVALAALGGLILGVIL